MTKSESVALDDFVQSVEAQEQGRDVEIRHPQTGEPIGLTITLAGPDSDRYRLAWRGEIRGLASDGSLAALSDAKDMESKRRIAAASVLSWSPNPSLKGQVLECSADNAEAIFKALPWIFDQCWAAILDRQGFTKR